MKNFFKSKLNITLVVLQCVAVAFFCIGNAWPFCFLLAIVTEGAFFIMLGVKVLHNNKNITQKQEMLQNLPIQKSEIDSLEKRNKYTIRINKFQSILYILMGIFLIFMVIF